jgi:hypothetical protein
MRIRIMKTTSALISSLLFSLTAVSSVAFADGNSQSGNVFIEGTIQGNWKPAVTSVSNETPDVGKSLDLFLNSALGKTPRITLRQRLLPADSRLTTVIQNPKHEGNNFGS